MIFRRRFPQTTRQDLFAHIGTVHSGIDYWVAHYVAYHLAMSLLLNEWCKT